MCKSTIETETVFVNIPTNQLKDFLATVTKLFPEASYFGPEERDLEADLTRDYTN